MKTIKMFTTAANPDMVLRAGQTYRLPDKIAMPLLAGKMIHGMTADGKQITGGPCAVEIRDGRAETPERPDPDEHKTQDMIDDEDEDDEE